VSVPTEIPSSWDTAPVRPAAEVGPADDPIGPVLPTAPVPLEAATPEPELAADAIVIEAAPRHLPNPTLDEPVGSADSANSWDAVGGIEIDVVSRNAAGAPPPIEHVDEGFDPDALIIDPPR
jgi:hypothetical protein